MSETTATQSTHVFAESRVLLRLALPLMGAQLAQMGMGVMDAVMAGRYSSIDLAGVALGGSILWPVMMLFMGLIQAVTPTVSQLNGAKKQSEIGEVIRQGLWMAIVGGVVASIVLNNIAPVYLWMDIDPRAVAISVPYLTMTSLGLPALMCFFCLRFLADGLGFTRPALYIAVCAFLIKIPLNYALIYGEFGLPELGGVGCGVAQAIIMWFQLLAMLFVVTRHRFRVTQWASRFSAPEWQRIKPLLIIGLPIGATIFAEIGLFSFTTLLLGRYGAEVVAAHNIAMNINGVLFMPALALGMAGTIRIGFRVGAGEIEQARTSAAILIGMTIGIALVGSILIFLLRSNMVEFYTSELPVVELATTLLLFVAFFLVFDATQTACVGTLRGYKDTKRPMYIALVSYWVIGLPLGIVLGLGLIGEPMRVYGFWVGLAVGVGTAACLLSIRLWRMSGNTALIRQYAQK
jgi:MATE family multidrug resistance protein